MSAPVAASPRYSPGQRATSRGWWWFILAGIVLMLGYALVPDGLVRDLFYLAVGIGCVVAIVVGVRMHQPARPQPWFLMAVGQLLWVIGDTLYSLHDLAGSESFPAAGDYFYLAAYPVLALGLFHLVNRSRSSGDLPGTLDTWTVVVGLTLVSYELLGRPAIDTGVSTMATLVSVAYPFGDILLFAGLVGLVTTTGWWNASIKLLLTAVGLLIVADTASTSFGIYSQLSTSWLDYAWLASYLAWGAAALHPTMVQFSEPVPQSDPHFRRGRLVAAGVATLVAPVILAIQAALGKPIDVWPIVIGSVVLYSLVLARMFVAIQQITTVNSQRLELQDQLAFEATHDSLTLLPNRAHGLKLLGDALAASRESGSTTALLFIDLDRFKHINDTLGHASGDQVLRRVAERLLASVRGDDCAVRLGGDEFVVLLQDVGSADQALQVAERLVTSLSEPMHLGRVGSARLGASIGIALCEGGVTDADALLHEADTAAYRAKANGRGRAELFDGSMRQEEADAAALTTALSKAIEDDELTLHYQPIINTHTGEVEGYEALVRWDRPGHGLLSPAEFLPVAETTELICDVDAWVLQRATAQLAEWIRTLGSPGLVMTVNISSRHVGLRRIVDDVRRALALSDIPAQQLVLELSGAVLGDHHRAVRHLRELRDLGVAVSIDDFGSGFGALARLAHLPVDIVKIDGRFLDVDSAMASRLLHLMIQGAHTVGLVAVAQGVEHDKQLATLRALDCESVQGFHISRPMPADEVTRYHLEQLDDRFSGLLP